MKWGIMATGSIAQKFASTVNRMTDEGEILQAVASRTKESAENFARQHRIPEVFDSYKAMAESDSVDVIYIATPNNMHYENVKMCLLAGKHVLCEKPFTTSAAQAQELYALAEEKGLFLMEGFWIRFLPVLQKMQDLIKEGKLGEIRYIRSEYGFVAKGDRKVRKFNPQLGGGALLDIGIYNLGFLNMIMGKNPDSFTSDVHMTDVGTDDFSVIHLHYPQENGQGAEAVVTTAIGLDIQRKAAVIGTKGSIYLDDFQKAETMTVSLSDGEEYEIEIPFEINGFEYQIREASNCIREGRTHSGIYTPQMSLQTLSLIDDIRAGWNMKFPFEK